MNNGNQFRIFCVCLSAAKMTDAIGDEPGRVYWKHNPGLIVSVDVETVAAQAGIAAFDSWPVNDGWSQHSASMTEVTASFVREAFELHQQGLLADQPLSEPHCRVEFEPPETISH